MTTKTIKNLVMVSTHGQMEKNSKVNGNLVTKTEKVYSLTPKVNPEKVSGKTVRE